MWRQMGIANSFTMEATFCGANFGDMAKGRHFHVGDFEEMGRHFCEVLLEYSEAKSSDRSEMTQAFVELACKMTRDILRQTLGNYHLENKESVCIPRDETSEQKEGQRSDSPSEGNQDDSNKSSEFGVKAFPSSNGRPVSFMDVRVDAVKKQDVDVELSVKSVHAESFNDCLKILDNLNIVDRFDESDSSDSDSDSDESDSKADEADPSGNGSERKKKKKKKKKKKPKHWWDMLSKPAGPETNQGSATIEDSSSKGRKVKTSFGKFVNPYTNRSNGGIPIYSQERIQERAKKVVMYVRFSTHCIQHIGCSTYWQEPMSRSLQLPC
ncbi:PREDICTED: cytosolic carboxypeptidase 3-like [Acropora digitifera]|uniref:cytosolic carboxypeptidase 3-like n=1 Tax=Acropora digitifera TaxID=70779 RepID=UPI00077AD7CD|nr:PREDICTED: cytosolic carboxypeptidase 3-like [Acropora digitifera]